MIYIPLAQTQLLSCSCLCYLVKHYFPVWVPLQYNYIMPGFKKASRYVATSILYIKM